MDTITLTYPAATAHISYDLKRGIEEAFASWERYLERSHTLKVVPMLDDRNNQYVLHLVEDKNGAYKSNTLAHLEIKNGKIWILTDNTEEGIATDLLAAGIPKTQIVLAFYPPETRELGEFAVS